MGQLIQKKNQNLQLPHNSCAAKKKDQSCNQDTPPVPFQHVQKSDLAMHLSCRPAPRTGFCLQRSEPESPP